MTGGGVQESSRPHSAYFNYISHRLIEKRIISLQTGFHPQHLHVTVARRETTSEDPDAGHLKRQSRPLNNLTACAVRDKLVAARNDLVIVH